VTRVTRLSCHVNLVTLEWDLFILEVRYYPIIIFENSISRTMLQNCAPNLISTLEISLIVPIKENVIRVKFDRQSKIKKQSSECSLIVIRVNIRVERGNSSRKLDKRNDKILRISLRFARVNDRAKMFRNANFAKD